MTLFKVQMESGHVYHVVATCIKEAENLACRRTFSELKGQGSPEVFSIEKICDQGRNYKLLIQHLPPAPLKMPKRI